MTKYTPDSGYVYRIEAAQRLEPIECSQGCGKWITDPWMHHCIYDVKYPDRSDCGCREADQGIHRNETCSLLGELTPRWKWLR